MNTGRTVETPLDPILSDALEHLNDLSLNHVRNTDPYDLAEHITNIQWQAHGNDLCAELKIAVTEAVKEFLLARLLPPED